MLEKLQSLLYKGQEEFDAASLHEEFTKVKDIARSELSKYEMDTCYFPPFLLEYKNFIKLFFCESCLMSMKRKQQLSLHMVWRRSDLIGGTFVDVITSVQNIQDRCTRTQQFAPGSHDCGVQAACRAGDLVPRRPSPMRCSPRRLNGTRTSERDPD